MQALWKARKGAFGAIGTLAPNYYVQDGVVPRSQLPEMMRGIAAMSKQFDLPIANVFHAGDGNLHPNILFDMRHPRRLRPCRCSRRRHAARLSAAALPGNMASAFEHRALINEDDLAAMTRGTQFSTPTAASIRQSFFPTPAR